MTDLIRQKETETLYDNIRIVLNTARKHSLMAVNKAMVDAYWTVGKLIVEAQGGSEKATYGANMINAISERLTKEFGRGFTATNLRYMRQFYLAFPIRHAVSDKLSWTHIRQLIKISNPQARAYYAEEAAKAQWSTRQLERQIATQYYERLLSTQIDKNVIEEKAKQSCPNPPERFEPLSLIHDPFVLEFLDVKPDSAFKETGLEMAIISHLQEFLLELGRGFAFIGRQKRITLDGQHFYPDLVFYNVITKNYVIIDLKMGRADYSDVGQMQLYVNYFNMEICTETDNPTIGIVLCAEKNDAVVRYTLGNRTDIGVFAAKYKLYLPSEEELRREIEQTRQNFKLLKG